MRGHRYFGAAFERDFSRHVGGGSPPSPKPAPPPPTQNDPAATEAAAQVAKAARMRRGRYATILTNPTGGDFTPSRPAGARTLGGD